MAGGAAQEVSRSEHLSAPTKGLSVQVGKRSFTPLCLVVIFKRTPLLVTCAGPIEVRIAGGLCLVHLGSPIYYPTPYTTALLTQHGIRLEPNYMPPAGYRLNLEHSP